MGTFNLSAEQLLRAAGKYTGTRLGQKRMSPSGYGPSPGGQIPKVQSPSQRAQSLAGEAVFLISTYHCQCTGLASEALGSRLSQAARHLPGSPLRPAAMRGLCASVRAPNVSGLLAVFHNAAGPGSVHDLAHRARENPERRFIGRLSQPLLRPCPHRRA